MTTTKKPFSFHIIRHRGQVNRGQLPDGRWVYRTEKIYIPEWNRFIPTAPYEEHFLYELPVQDKGPSVRCSCGSFGVIAGYSAYKDHASQQGLLYVCYQHSNFGVHLKGGTKWI
jgi:hypothetical protein